MSSSSNSIRSGIVTGLLMAMMAMMAMVLATGPVMAQTRIRPGFNLFSVEQDKEIGRQSAVDAERQLPILHDPTTQQYITALTNRLAAKAPGADFDYQSKVVNASDINAFALPGGYLYVNRGLIEAAESEGMLAGVMAHEIAHVALRHGTNQASKAWLAQAGLGILGGLIDEDRRSTQRTMGLLGGFGLNALFLKFSRTDEEQADVVGAQILAKAGYDPMDMVSFFKMLEGKRRREPNKVEQFFSSHPTPGDRASRVKRERKMLTVRKTEPVGGFSEIRRRLLGMPPAKSMQQIAQAPLAAGAARSTASTANPAVVKRVADSTPLLTFAQRGRLFTIDDPAGWRAWEPGTGIGETFAPEGAIGDDGGDEEDLTLGAIDNDDGYGDQDGDPPYLVRATDDLLKEILRSNPGLRIVSQSERGGTIGGISGTAALFVVLSGRSPVTRKAERVTLFTRELRDEHVIYALFVTRAEEYDELGPTFEHMMTSLRVNDGALHP